MFEVVSKKIWKKVALMFQYGHVSVSRSEKVRVESPVAHHGTVILGNPPPQRRGLINGLSCLCNRLQFGRADSPKLGVWQVQPPVKCVKDPALLLHQGFPQLQHTDKGGHPCRAPLQVGFVACSCARGFPIVPWLTQTWSSPGSPSCQ